MKLSLRLATDKLMMSEHLPARRSSQIIPATELTTQEAAALLNVSLPYVAQLLDEGRIPFHIVGIHRRVLFRDVMDYKAEHRHARSAVLDKLTRLDQELGLTE